MCVSSYIKFAWINIVWKWWTIDATDKLRQNDIILSIALTKFNKPKRKVITIKCYW